jgi:hypothetical protein
MMEPDMIAPGALRGFVRFEMQQRQVDHAVGQKDALGEAGIGLAHHFHPEGVFIELGGPPGVGHRHREVTQLSHGVALY